MKPELAVSNDAGILLDHKARRALIDALRFQLAAWEAKQPEDMDEDEFADLQNDIGYLGSLLTRLEDDPQRRRAAQSTS
jgi:hypothetical protein